MPFLPIFPFNIAQIIMAAAEKMHVSDVEDVGQANGGSNQTGDVLSPAPLLDRHGLPLSPQPSSDPMDPLNWKYWIKIMVLVEVSIFSFLALLSASLIVRLPSLVSPRLSE